MLNTCFSYTLCQILTLKQKTTKKNDAAKILQSLIKANSKIMFWNLGSLINFYFITIQNALKMFKNLKKSFDSENP